jgi:hypothetical protein
MSTTPTPAAELLAQYKRQKQADILATLTPSQQVTFDRFASTVLGTLAEVETLTFFGMVKRHELNLRFNYMIRKDVFPGGFSAALARMGAADYIDTIRIDGTLVVYIFNTIEKVRGDSPEGMPIPMLNWVRAWSTVLEATGEAIPKKIRAAAQLK